MDAIDRKIVVLLQEDASLSLAQIAHRVGLSQSPCWKRIQRLEKSGVILKRVALISPESISATSSGSRVEAGRSWATERIPVCSQAMRLLRT